mgnify:CR=1 FL=1
MNDCIDELRTLVPACSRETSKVGHLHYCFVLSTQTLSTCLCYSDLAIFVVHPHPPPGRHTCSLSGLYFSLPWRGACDGRAASCQQEEVNTYSAPFLSLSSSFMFLCLRIVILSEVLSGILYGIYISILGKCHVFCCFDGGGWGVKKIKWTFTVFLNS